MYHEAKEAPRFLRCSILVYYSDSKLLTHGGLLASLKNKIISVFKNVYCKQLKFFLFIE